MNIREQKKQAIEFIKRWEIEEMKDKIVSHFG